MNLVRAARDPANWREYNGKPTKKYRRLMRMKEKHLNWIKLDIERENARMKKWTEKSKKDLEWQERSFMRSWAATRKRSMARLKSQESSYSEGTEKID